jgi:hypothetical protein
VLRRFNPLGSTGLPSPPPCVRGGAGSSGQQQRLRERYWGLRWVVGEHISLAVGSIVAGGRLERVDQGFSFLVRAVGALCLAPSEGEC